MKISVTKVVYISSATDKCFESINKKIDSHFPRAFDPFYEEIT